ncbi:hypothetical protein TRIATDRAFT_236112 [Trichoderma atroviride IMI 206040]|uniref:Uncharacterized protein n=1 Tax=Hypocrea atroviridis (strain ATCC 20476 / IMI 206040) TaxID=452589 RepID=G9NK19_HYPAI|nr:uncharacterized protein TRIATDRAFT_236112 [Trichoderma atroviride IMI 206040]EHK49238.1 hypothetical protein TRIATDRAFT_236112 [Trichoderma atroviride IMI 206040]
MEFFLKKKKNEKKKLQNGDVGSIEFLASIVTIFLARGWQLWFMRHVAFDRCLFALLARLDFLMSANYGRRQSTWDRCSFFFFLVYGLLLHGVCAFFHIAFALLQVSTQRTVFSFYGAALRPLWCLVFRSGASFTEPSCTIKRTEKKR